MTLEKQLGSILKKLKNTVANIIEIKNTVNSRAENVNAINEDVQAKAEEMKKYVDTMNSSINTLNILETQISDLKTSVSSTTDRAEKMLKETQAIRDTLTDALVWKGSVENYAALPTTNVRVGDTYNVTAADSAHNINAGDNVVWDGSKWDAMGGIMNVDSLAVKGHDANFKDVTATTFHGALNGKADSATTADVAKTVAWNNIGGKPATFPSGIQFDNIPTEGSANAVKSSGIKTALDNKLDKTGTAVSATKLSTARTIQTNLASTTATAFDGSANITPGVTGTLPVSNGGTGATNLDNVTVGTSKKVHTTVSSGTVGELVKATMGDNDAFRIAVGGDANAGWAEIATADDGTEPIYVRQYADARTDGFATPTRTATLLDGSGNTSFPGKVTAPTFSGNLNGNANTATTATKLQTARTINFNGALDGNVTFDGSKDVSVTLSEFNHTEAVIDLTDATKYDTDTYYPVVSNAYWSDAEHKYRCWTPIHAVKTAPWGTLGTGGGDYSADLKVRNNMNGWGARKAYVEILMNSCHWTNGRMPITYSQMENCGRSVFFVCGGGKYWLSSTRNATWELKTDTFTENGNTVAPTKTYFTPESRSTIKTIGINISGNATSATTATKAANDSNGANIASTYVKKAGDTVTGKITFASTDLNALPEVKKTSDDNMSGVRFSSKTKFLGAVGKRLSNGEDLLNLRSDNSTTDIVLDSRNYNSYVPTKTGTGASGTWGISITGNASTATKLATPRTLALTGKVAGSATFDGSANASINVTSVNADSATNDSNGANIANTYLKKSGGTMTGALNFANGTKNIVGDDVAIGDFNRGGTLGVQGKSGKSSIMLIKNGAAWSANSEGAIMMYNSSTQSLDFNFQ